MVCYLQEFFMFLHSYSMQGKYSKHLMQFVYVTYLSRQRKINYSIILLLYYQN